MNDSVPELGKLAAVPSSCSSYEVTGDALKLIYLGALAVRAFLKSCLCIFKSTVHAAVAVVVD